MTANMKGLLHALQQSINEAILDSHNVAAAMAALKRTGNCPVFTVDISMQGLADAETEPIDDSIDCPTPEPTFVHPSSSVAEELVLSDADVKFLSALGITDPSWCHPSDSPTA
jgi:hypothetical protein